jgi:signal transduction histidine kinase
MSEYLFLASALLSVSTAVGVVLINPRRPINQVFGMAAGLIGLWLICIFMVATFGRDESASANSQQVFWLRLSSAIGAMIAWLLWLMKATLVTDKPTLGASILRTWPWLFLSVALAGIAFSESYIPSHSTPTMQIRGSGFVVLNWALLAQCCLFFFFGLRESRDLAGIRRLEMRFFVLHTALAGSLVVIINLAAHTFGIPLIRQFSPLVFLALFAFTTWAVSSNRIFDARHIIATVTHRLVFLVVLCIATAALSYALLSVARWPSNVLLATLFAGLLVLTLDQPGRRWFGLDRQHILRPSRATIIGWARAESNPARLQALFEGFLREWCQTEGAEVLLERGRLFSGRTIAFPKSSPAMQVLNSHGWLTPESVRRQRSMPGAEEAARIMKDLDAGAILAVPRGSLEPTMIIVLGHKDSRRPYTHTDIDLLLEITELMDNIFTHTRLSLHGARLARAESAATLSGGLAHDLNNLTTPVVSFLRLMDARPLPDPRESEMFAQAKHAIGLIQDYIRESLFFSRRSHPSLQATNSEDVISTVLRTCGPRAATEGIQLVPRLAGSIRFTADPTLIHRLLVNLIQNAMDASPPGSVVEIAAFTLDEGYLCFEVSDQGSGIPRHLHEQVFEPYFTTKLEGRESRGAGLGLAISRKIEELHGGEISLRRSSGKGTTIAVVLPEKPPAPSGATPKREPKWVDSTEARGDRLVTALPRPAIV